MSGLQGYNTKPHLLKFEGRRDTNALVLAAQNEREAIEEAKKSKVRSAGSNQSISYGITYAVFGAACMAAATALGAYILIKAGAGFVSSVGLIPVIKASAVGGGFLFGVSGVVRGCSPSFSHDREEDRKLELLFYAWLSFLSSIIGPAMSQQSVASSLTSFLLGALLLVLPVLLYYACFKGTAENSPQVSPASSIEEILSETPVSAPAVVAPESCSISIPESHSAAEQEPERVGRRVTFGSATPVRASLQSMSGEPKKSILKGLAHTTIIYDVDNGEMAFETSV